MKVNPLIVNPLKTKANLLRREEELEDAKYYSNSGCMFVIQGLNGSGKTYFSKMLVKELKKNTRIIFIDAKKINKQDDIEQIIIKSGPFFDKLRNKKPKGSLLIIDHAEALTRKSYEKIKYYYDEDYIKSVGLVINKYGDVEVHPSIKSRIGGRIISIRPLTKNEVFEIYKELVEFPQLSIYNLEEVFEKNNRKIRETLNKIAQIHTINFEEPIKEELNSIICKKCNETLEEINGDFRCKKCQTYCTVCGHLVEEKDVRCSSCLANFG